MTISILIYLVIGFFGSAIKDSFPETVCGFHIERTGIGIVVVTLFWPIIIVGKAMKFLYDIISGNI